MAGNVKYSMLDLPRLNQGQRRNGGRIREDR
jgi:hypothetical protein